MIRVVSLSWTARKGFEASNTSQTPGERGQARKVAHDTPTGLPRSSPPARCTVTRLAAEPGDYRPADVEDHYDPRFLLVLTMRGERVLDDCSFLARLCVSRPGSKSAGAILPACSESAGS